jgi:hypothetical protein
MAVTDMLLVIAATEALHLVATAVLARVGKTGQRQEH